MDRSIAVGCGLVLALTLASPSTTRAQSDAGEALARGGVEIGTALSFSFSKEKGDDDSATVVNVPVRIGVMLLDRFEIELEALVTYVDLFDDGETGVIGAGHLLYHFGSGSTTPYVLAGAGYGNAVEFLGIAGKADQNLTVLRAGAGFKTFVGRHCSLRVEYRFTNYRGKDEYQDFPYYLDIPPLSRDVRLYDHKVQVGISLWL